MTVDQPFKMPDRIGIDARGFGWRAWDDEDYYSMVPQNPDNSPIPEPITWFVPAAVIEHDRDEWKERAERYRASSNRWSTAHAEAIRERDAAREELRLLWERFRAAENALTDAREERDMLAVRLVEVERERDELRLETRQANDAFVQMSGIASEVPSLRERVGILEPALAALVKHTEKGVGFDFKHDYDDFYAARENAVRALAGGSVPTEVGVGTPRPEGCES